MEPLPFLTAQQQRDGLDRSHGAKRGPQYDPPNLGASLDENCGVDRWLMMPLGCPVDLLSRQLASAFLARWLRRPQVEGAEGVFRVLDDEPTPRAGARLHRTP